MLKAKIGKVVPAQLVTYYHRLQGTSFRLIYIYVEPASAFRPDVSDIGTITCRKILSFLMRDSACISSLQALGFPDVPLGLPEKEFIYRISATLQHFRSCPFSWDDFILEECLQKGILPNLQSLEVSNPTCSMIDPYWHPLDSMKVVSSSSSNKDSHQGPNAAQLPLLQCLVNKGSNWDISDTDIDSPTFGLYRNLLWLELSCNLSPMSSFSIAYPLVHLTYLSISRSTFELPSEADYLPRLEELHIRHHCSVQTVHTILRYLNGRKLRVLRLESRFNGRGNDLWLDFCKRAPLLQELIIKDVEVTQLVGSLPFFPNLSSLMANHINLPSSFLDAATVCIPRLTKLEISGSTNISSGPLVRLIQSKKGQLVDLDITGCRDLQKEAVDWIKANVARVQWTGWRDRNEPKGWSFR